MRTLFYDLVTSITNWITGLDNEHLTIFNVGTWINMSEKVEKLLIIGLVSIGIVIICSAFSCILDVYKELHSESKKES